ncbi:MAG: N-acetyltransferase, partial [Proteobacteria bacterium]|nr:N-acetyltransferase [Pseudomonadota bacterium]
MTASIRSATEADLPDIVRLVRALAEYEKLLHEVVSTETDFRERLFGPCPVAHAILAEAGGQAVGLALYYYTFSTFTGRCDLFLEDLFVMPEHRG